MAAVEEVRARIAAGDVYQVNVCRVLSAPLPPGADLVGLAGLLAAGNPAPHQGVLRLPDHDLQVATASPELFLRRDGRTVVVRADQGHRARRPPTCCPRTRRERHDRRPGAQRPRRGVPRPARSRCPTCWRWRSIRAWSIWCRRSAAGCDGDVGWPELLAATFPPGSVTGAPKSSALRVIDDLEHTPRDVYCGAVGWVDADAGTAELAVAIRTFWAIGGRDPVRHGRGHHLGLGPVR